jgi:hypothetical protein
VCAGTFLLPGWPAAFPADSGRGRLHSGLGFTLAGGLCLLGVTLLAATLTGAILLMLLLGGGIGKENLEGAALGSCGFLFLAFGSIVLALIGSFMIMGALDDLAGRNWLGCSLAAFFVAGALVACGVFLLVPVALAAQQGIVRPGDVMLPGVFMLVGGGTALLSALAHGFFLCNLARSLGDEATAGSAGQYTLFLAATSSLGGCGMCLMDFLNAGDLAAGLVTRFGLLLLFAGQLSWWCSLVARLRWASRPR